MINNLGEKKSILSQYLAEIRNINIHSDSMRFRRNLERISEIIAIEISKTLTYEKVEVITPLGSAEVPILKEYPVLIPVLRAGLPMHRGLQRIFDKSASAFISAYRKAEKNEKFIVKIEYISSPDLSGKTIILADPMLATGSSIVAAYKEIVNRGKPKHIHIVVAIASMQGINYIKKHLPDKNITLWVGAIDDELTAQAYIVPGLGDAGDLAFGSKD
ncbi:MAG: uracil phosphoribosyltransferase [Bacteroidales bacterium]|nr:uracil phosphoribosyltransferase [Bacteroidales bacterium]